MVVYFQILSSSSLTSLSIRRSVSSVTESVGSLTTNGQIRLNANYSFILTQSKLSQCQGRRPPRTRVICTCTPSFETFHSFVSFPPVDLPAQWTAIFPCLPLTTKIWSHFVVFRCVLWMYLLKRYGPQVITACGAQSFFGCLGGTCGRYFQGDWIKLRWMHLSELSSVTLKMEAALPPPPPPAPTPGTVEQTCYPTRCNDP
jgi:hypothetical protein